jgi:hypothetical protein
MVIAGNLTINQALADVTTGYLFLYDLLMPP